MNAIVAGKIEKTSGAMVFNSVATKEVYGHGYRAITNNSNATWFRLTDANGKIIIGNIANFLETTFTSGSFPNIARGVVLKGWTVGDGRVVVTINDVNNNYDVYTGFKELELGTLEIS
ncbi:MAG TPA: hypothetical protein DCW90_08555 [Lachnospiraceae bacterium]|nr:hypothetical protein [Lachnospiraceae bacterium]